MVPLFKKTFLLAKSAGMNNKDDTRLRRLADDHLSWGIHVILMGHVVIGAFTPFHSGFPERKDKDERKGALSPPLGTFVVDFLFC